MPRLRALGWTCTGNSGAVWCEKSKRVNAMPERGCSMWVRAMGYDVEEKEKPVVPFGYVPGFSEDMDDLQD